MSALLSYWYTVMASVKPPLYIEINAHFFQCSLLWFEAISCICKCRDKRDSVPLSRNVRTSMSSFGVFVLVVEHAQCLEYIKRKGKYIGQMVEKHSVEFCLCSHLCQIMYSVLPPTPTHTPTHTHTHTHTHNTPTHPPHPTHTHTQAWCCQCGG